jgi:hypothetical protein
MIRLARSDDRVNIPEGGIVLLSQIAEVASECIKHPNRRSVWSPELGRYICPDDPEQAQLVAIAAQGKTSAAKAPAKAAINTNFKLVFLTAVGGTLLFMSLCVALTLMAGREAPPLYEKVIMSLFDLAKVSFGTIVGLLGAQAMQDKG